MVTNKKVLSYIPLIIGIGLLIGAASFVPWNDVAPYLDSLSVGTVVTLILLSAVFYFGRSLRYFVMLKMLGQALPLRTVILACIVAQPVAVLPGGEFYRTVMLKKYGNVPLNVTTPAVFAQTLAEAISLIVIGLIGAVSIGHYQIGLTLIALIFALILFAVRLKPSTVHAVITKLPKVDIHHTKLATFMERNRILLSRHNFPTLVAVTLITILSGAAIAFTAASALGINLSSFQALLGYSIPTLLETISFLPGGFGISEGGAVGVYTLFDINFPMAVALTLIVRASTFGMGFVFGLISFVVIKLRPSLAFA